MKTVLITGAGRGIGLALTKEFLKAGYHVLGTYRTEKTAKELLALADGKSTKGKLSTAICDIAEPKTLTNLKDALKKIGSIDILVNNSGVIGAQGRSLSEVDVDGVADVLDVNTLGPMRVTKLALPYLNKGATVAQITSLMGSIGDNASGGYYDYRMSKAALNMFNMCLSRELGGITCLTLHPGWVQTDMGGKGATVPVLDCARGLFKVITEAKPAQTGKFFDFRGKELPW